MKVQECVLSEDVIAADSAEAALWHAIVVPEAIKERLRNQTLLSLLVRPDLPFAMTALHGLCTLYGPPGTGKTTLARGLPAQVAGYVPGGEVRRIEINPHGLMSAEHGQSQRRVSELLGEYVPGLAADGMPTVVILDEVESMAVARSAASLAANPADVHRATDAVLTALDLNAIEHPHLFFVATSNFTTALDEAFLSRSDAAILIPLPEIEALREILASTLLALADKYPALEELAHSSAMTFIAEAAHGLDGRRTRKVVFEALAQRLNTVLDPGCLTREDLTTAVRNAVAENGRLEVSDAAH
ncbi:AAA family ATPase [Nocardia jejuensis]|uniref:AAA family ATPase n=1 Tax=Nocardia jejuensis TaxID=328049 RepID=UPI00082B7579|nr:AAA family ATPase [Nocardia jejuensis]